MSDGRIHLGVKARSASSVNQVLSRLGIPSEAVTIEALQPMRTGSEMAPGDGHPLYVRLLVSEKRLPPPSGDFVMQLAEDPQQFYRTWSLFELGDESLPEVDWESESVVFIGLGESGSCPLTLEGLSLGPEKMLMAHLAYSGEHYICTSDYSPRTFVAAIAKESLPGGPLQATIKGHLRGTVIPLR